MLFYLPLVSQGSLKTLLLEGMGAPDGNGVVSGVAKPVINESGQVAFTSRYTGTNGFPYDIQGLSLYEPETDEILRIARTGDKAPGTVGDYFAFAGSSQDSTPFLTLNDAGQIGIYASATGDVNFPDMTGAGPHLFDKDGAVRIEMVGAPDPRALGVFKTFLYHGLTNSGQMVFLGTVEIDSFTISGGLFATDSPGGSLKNILMVGDVLPNSTDTFTSFDFRGTNNNRFTLFLADDSDGDDEEPGSQDLWIAGPDV
ncbi:MAG: hypothetical protein KJT03_21405, partial [Verrucomicrobiae bacterium]|nr:hypothetical protein [Verrucomicrobiae bacterium]